MQNELFKTQPKISGPMTRYQGSKRKLLSHLSSVFSQFDFDSVLDLFSGSGSVTYLLRRLDKTVTANDYLHYNANTARLFLSTVTENDLKDSLAILPDMLHSRSQNHLNLVEENYSGIFFIDEENSQIDRFCQNIQSIPSHLRMILVYAVGQSLLKKRPYNLFHRANLAMRLSDVERSFGNKVTWEKSIQSHATKAIHELASLGLQDTCEGYTYVENSTSLHNFPNKFDLVYLDPPYIPSKGKSIDYADFYGFLDGLINYKLFETPSSSAPHRPIYSISSAWEAPKSASEELLAILKKWSSSNIVMSYRGDGALSPNDIVAIFDKVGRDAVVSSLGKYKYALSASSESDEIIITAPPLKI